MRLALLFLGVRRRRLRRRSLRNLLDNGSKIMPETKRDEQFGHNKYRSEQQVSWIVQKRRLSTLEHLVPDDFQSEADDNQRRRDKPHTGSTRMIHDHRRG